MVQFAAQKEVLHDILEITKDGTESYNDALDVEHFIFAQHNENLPETICWGTKKLYCPEGCHFQDEDVEETNSNTSLTESTEIPQALDERWELQQKFNTDGASRCSLLLQTHKRVGHTATELEKGW